MESTIASTNTGTHASVFECPICMEPPTDPVATPCGHVSCWLCIQQWLGDDDEVKWCPVCRHPINSSLSILALHGFDDDGTSATLTTDIPQRPPNPPLFFPGQFVGGISNRLEIDPHYCTQDSVAVSLAYNEFFRVEAERLQLSGEDWKGYLDSERDLNSLSIEEGQKLDESILELRRQLALAQGNPPNDESPKKRKRTRAYGRLA